MITDAALSSDNQVIYVKLNRTVIVDRKTQYVLTIYSYNYDEYRLHYKYVWTKKQLLVSYELHMDK